MIKHVFWSYCRISVILVRFYCDLNFLDRFSKNTQISNLIQIRPVGAKLFHEDGWTDGQIDGQTDRQTDRQTDMTKSIVAFAILRTRLKSTWSLMAVCNDTLWSHGVCICCFVKYFRKDEISIIIALRVSVT